MRKRIRPSVKFRPSSHVLRGIYKLIHVGLGMVWAPNSLGPRTGPKPYLKALRMPGSAPV